MKICLFFCLLLTLEALTPSFDPNLRKVSNIIASKLQSNTSPRYCTTLASVSSASTGIPPSWYKTQRYDANQDLMHFEFRAKPTASNPFSYIDYILPSKLKSKPLAKVGFRTKPSSSRIMDETIASLFNTSPATNVKVFVFVYMWVNPAYRGRDIGDALLSLAEEQSVRDEVDYMLLVHDDQGTGKLVDYYKSRGFIPIFDFIDKGMIKQLRH